MDGRRIVVAFGRAVLRFAAAGLIFIGWNIVAQELDVAVDLGLHEARETIRRRLVKVELERLEEALQAVIFDGERVGKDGMQVEKVGEGLCDLSA